MEQYSESYKRRCMKKLNEWNAPITDWDCVYMYDVAEDDGALFDCELCYCPKVRYVHVMRHEEYFEDVHVGCICAGIMEGDILAAKERDRKMKNRAKRKANYLKREWKKQINGSFVLRYKNRWIAIIPSHSGIGDFIVICDSQQIESYKGRKINNFLSAVHVVFDVIDPPIGGA